MKSSIVAASLCGLLSCGFSASVQPAKVTAAKAAGNSLAGDYVETRSASVFAGACHYNGEYMTVGRDAIMAWNITGGSWNGTNIAGVRAVAIVTSESNLADSEYTHKSVLVIDSAATDAQATAAAAAIESQCGTSLGDVAGVRRAAVNFSDVERTYHVSADGFATIAVQAMPNDECCKQPNLVWYQPMMPLIGRKVGYTIESNCLSSVVGDQWHYGQENSAFYGSFRY